MLKDPRWDKEPSLAGFALFVASKPPDESYEWENCLECAVGQYLASIHRRIPLMQWLGDLAVANRLAQGEWGKPGRTFGQLADRILAYQMA